MIEPQKINAIVNEIISAIPEGIKGIPDEARSSIKAAVLATFSKMDLVTREEFDIQTAVLARTREKLTTLEAQVEALEKSQADNTST